MARERKEELHWVQTQIEALILSRNGGLPFTAEEEARYRELCRRERILLGQPYGA